MKEEKEGDRKPLIGKITTMPKIVYKAQRRKAIFKKRTNMTESKPFWANIFSSE